MIRSYPRTLLVVLTVCLLSGLLIYVLVRQALKNPLDQLEELQNSDMQADVVQPLETDVAARALNYDPLEFAGTQSCVQCHNQICATYGSHAMAISAAPVLSASDLEDYEIHTQFDALRPSASKLQLSYQVDRTAESVIHTEIVKDLDGAELFRISEPIMYSIGSGKRGRSYVLNKQGRLYMSPVTWYTEGNCWDMSPSYSKFNRHFERRIVDGCVICHIGVANPDPEHADIYATPAFVEPAIGCERCHGAGKDHISFHSNPTRTLDADPIINPARLPTGPRESICFQCHLHGVGRITRYGKSEFDFRPGDDITKIWAIFIRGAKVDEQNLTEAVGQAEQMFVSRCYTESDPRMSCLSCHDPHESPTMEERHSYFNRRCQECHQSDSSSHCSRQSDELVSGMKSQSCIDCHMPKLLANDVPHTSQTDHRIPRIAGAGQVISEDAERPDLYVYGAERGGIPPDEVDCCRGILMVQNAEETEDRFMASRAIPYLLPWIETHPADMRALEALGVAHWITKDIDAARQAWQRALALDPDSEMLLLRMMILCHDTGKFAEGIRYAKQLIAINPFHFEHHARLTHMLGQTNRIPEAIAQARLALKLRPWDMQMRGWLAEALRIIGDLEGAAGQQAIFEKVRPVQD